MFEETVYQLKKLSTEMMDLLDKLLLDSVPILNSSDLFKFDSNFEQLIKSGANINIQNYFGSTPLHYSKTIEQIKLLLEAGANPNIQNNKGNTPLHIFEIKEQIKLLLNAKANPNIQNKFGNTPLHFATNDEQIKLLLKAKANPNIQNNNGETPLHIYNRKEQIKLLLEAKADPNIQNNNGNTPIFFRENTIEVLKELLKGNPDLTIKNKEGLTAKEYLSKSCYNQHYVELIEEYENKKLKVNSQDLFKFDSNFEQLIKDGADVNITSIVGSTPLYFAKTIEQMKLLLDAGANINHQNNKGNTPLHNIFNTEEIIKELLKGNPDLTLKNKNKLTAKEFFQQNGMNNHVRLIEEYENKKLKSQDLFKFDSNFEQLIKNGADVNVQDIYGETPLHYIRSRSISIEQVKLLLKAGANPNIKDIFGNAPLHNVNTPEQIKLLIEAGANINIQNNHGSTRLFYGSNTEEMIKELLKGNPDLTLKNYQGLTAKEYLNKYFCYSGNIRLIKEYEKSKMKQIFTKDQVQEIIEKVIKEMNLKK